MQYLSNYISSLHSTYTYWQTYRKNMDQQNKKTTLHPQRLTWNLKIMFSFLRNLLFQGLHFQVNHVKLQGCNLYIYNFFTQATESAVAPHHWHYDWLHSRVHRNRAARTRPTKRPQDAQLGRWSWKTLKNTHQQKASNDCCCLFV